jgi:hypothetical protein
MTDIQSGLSKFPWKHKILKLQGLFKRITGCNMSQNIRSFTFSLGLLPSDPGRNERPTLGKVPP